MAATETPSQGIGINNESAVTKRKRPAEDADDGARLANGHGLPEAERALELLQDLLQDLVQVLEE